MGFDRQITYDANRALPSRVIGVSSNVVCDNILTYEFFHFFFFLLWHEKLNVALSIFSYHARAIIVVDFGNVGARM